MIVYLVASDIFWRNEFSPSKPDAGLSDTKAPGKLLPGTVVNYKKVFRIHTGEYVHANQDDEPCNRI